MKKFKMVFAICAMMLVLCGCSVKTEYGMSIRNDKSMDFSVITAVDEEVIIGMLSMNETSEEPVEYTEQEKWNMVEQTLNLDEDPLDYGFERERYQEDDYYGYVYTIKIKNIDDISGETIDFTLSEFNNVSDSIVFIKDGNKYKTSFIMSNDEQLEGTDVDTDVDMEVELDTKFIVTLPNKPISNNATKVSEDGKTLTWELSGEHSQNISFEFSLKDEVVTDGVVTDTDSDNEKSILPFGENTILYIGIGIGVVILISVFSIVLMSKNKKKKNNITPAQPMMEQPQVAPVQPMMEQPQVAPVQPMMEQPQVTPVQPMMEQPQVAPVQPMMEQPQVTPVQPMMEQPQVAPAQPMMEQPQVAPAQPMMEQPQVAPTQPMMEQPQVAPAQPMMEQPQVAPTQNMPSVADIMNLSDENNNKSNQ